MQSDVISVSFKGELHACNEMLCYTGCGTACAHLSVNEGIEFNGREALAGCSCVASYRSSNE